MPISLGKFSILFT